MIRFVRRLGGSLRRLVSLLRALAVAGTHARRCMLERTTYSSRQSFPEASLPQTLEAPREPSTSVALPWYAITTRHFIGWRSR